MTKNKAYEVLGIPSDASTEEIKAAYAELSKKYHPEENPKEFQEIYEAYVTLVRRKKNQRQLAKLIAFEAQLETENSMPEQVEDSDSYDFSDVDNAKKKDFEHRLQEMITQLEATKCSDKSINNRLLSEILNSKDYEVLYNNVFIERLIDFIRISHADYETRKIVKKYLRQWDETLNNNSELLRTLEEILEERDREEYASEKKQKVAGIVWGVILGFMYSLTKNFWGTVKVGVGLGILGASIFGAYVFLKKRNAGVFSYVFASFVGFAILLTGYFLEFYRWVAGTNDSKTFYESLVLVFGFFTVVFFIKWRKKNDQK